MIKKRDVVLFLIALALGLVGRAVWRLGRPAHDTLSGGVSSLPSDLSTAPDAGDKGLFSTLFSRPSSAIAPVNVPALSAPVPEKFGDAAPSSDETWASRVAGSGALGASGGRDSSAPPPVPGSGGTGGAPQWQTPPSNGGPSALGTFPASSAVAASPRAPSSPAMKVLKRLGKRTAGYNSAAVDLSGGHVGQSVAVPGASSLGAPSGPFGVPDPSVASAGTGAGPASAPAAPAVASAGDGGSPAALGASSGGDAGSAPSGDASAPAADAPPPDASTDTADGDPGAQQIDAVTPEIGAPQVSNGSNGVAVTPSGFFFAAKKGAGQTVQIMTIAGNGVKGMQFTSALHVDSNGAGDWYKKTKTGKATTSLKYSKTESLNPGKIPYIVVPKGLRKDYPDVRLGDYVAVTYGGKTVYAIIGDVGAPGIIGGGSIDLAAGLGMNPMSKGGGAPGGVTYVILTGTRDASPARDAQTIQEKGRELFARAGIPVQ